MLQQNLEKVFILTRGFLIVFLVTEISCIPGLLVQSRFFRLIENCTQRICESPVFYYNRDNIFRRFVINETNLVSINNNFAFDILCEMVVIFPVFIDRP